MVSSPPLGPRSPSLTIDGFCLASPKKWLPALNQFGILFGKLFRLPVGGRDRQGRRPEHEQMTVPECPERCRGGDGREPRRQAGFHAWPRQCASCRTSPPRKGARTSRGKRPSARRSAPRLPPPPDHDNYGDHHHDCRHRDEVDARTGHHTQECQDRDGSWKSD